MGTTQTLRPNANISGAAAYTLGGGGTTVWGNLSDNTDTLYVTRTSSGNRTVALDLGTYTIGGAEKVKRIRAAARVMFNAKPLTYAWTVAIGANILARRQRQAKNTAATTYYTDWVNVDLDQADVDALAFNFTDYASSAINRVYDVWVELDVIDQPTVTANAGATTTLRPTITWTYADGDGDPQTHYQVKVFSAAQYGAGGFDPDTSTATWDSGEVSSELETVRVDVALVNGTTYKAYVKVAHDGGDEPYWSAWDDSAAWTVAITPCTTPTVSGIYDSVDGRVELTVAGAAPPGGVTQTVRVERSTDSGVTWEAVRDWAEAPFDTPYSETVYDYEAPHGDIQYRARALGVNATDDDVSSAWSATNTETVYVEHEWWLKAITEPTLNLSGVRVLEAPTGQVTEQVSAFYPLGADKAVTVSTGLYGHEGTFNILAVDDDDTQHVAPVEALLNHQGVLQVASPFGTTRYIRVTSRSYTLLGTGDFPRVQWSVSWVEVDRPAVT